MTSLCTVYMRAAIGRNTNVIYSNRMSARIQFSHYYYHRLLVDSTRIVGKMFQFLFFRFVCPKIRKHERIYRMASPTDRNGGVALFQRMKSLI